MKKRNHSPGIKQLTRKGLARFIARTRKFVDAKAKDHDPNSRAAARRREQMLAGKLTASNGVVMQFEGTEGQDRESYSDTQDRESYTVDVFEHDLLGADGIDDNGNPTFDEEESNG